MPLTGKETVKLVLENGWVEIRQRGSRHHFKKEVFLSCHYFSSWKWRFGEGIGKKDSQRFRIVSFTFLSLFTSEVVEC